MVELFHREERSSRAGTRRTRKLLNDHGERERRAVNLSVTSRPEMSSTHFFGAALRGMPRTPVGGERLGKHGALSDGPSAALSGPSAAHSGRVYPATRCRWDREADEKWSPRESDALGAVSLSVLIDSISAARWLLAVILGPFRGDDLLSAVPSWRARGAAVL